MSAAWTTVIVAGVATMAMRSAFLVFAHRFGEMPPWARRVFRQIPPAALAAVTLPAFLRPGGVWDPWSARAFAGAVAAVVAWRTRNTALTLVVGLLIVTVIEW